SATRLMIWWPMRRNSSDVMELSIYHNAKQSRDRKGAVFDMMALVVMTTLRSDLAPVSEATTRNIRVEVIAQHSTEHSRPNEGEWVFQYTVRITNRGTEPVRLISRHWIITDGTDHIEEVKGPGV